MSHKLVKALTEDVDVFVHLCQELEQRGYEIDCPGAGGVMSINKRGNEPVFVDQNDTGYYAVANLLQSVAGSTWDEDKELLTQWFNAFNSVPPSDSPEY